MHLPRLARPIHRTDAGSFAAGVRPSAIDFEDGWDSPGNSNVRAYTKGTAQTFLEGTSDDLKKTIQSPGCLVRVKKGCHQPGSPHFTLDERGKKCKNATYAGTRSVHVPC